MSSTVRYFQTPTSNYPETINLTFPSSSKPYPSKRLQWTTCHKIIFLFSFVGLLFISAGILSYFFMTAFIKEKILENFSLREGSEVFQGWKSPPVTPIMAIRLFNMTNHVQFLEGKEKPNLTEVGPYIYTQKMEKEGISFTDHGTLIYSVRRYYYFSSILTDSRWSPSDVLILPNLPLFGAFQKMKNESDFAKGLFESLLLSYDFGKDKVPFLSLSVQEFLWGYDSLLISLNKLNSETCRESLQDWKSSSSDCDDIVHENLSSFGVFLPRNGTLLDEREIDTGEKNIDNRGKMISWKGQKKVNYWREDSCNILNGRDVSGLPLNLNKESQVSIYIGNLCRTVHFSYVKDVSHGQLLSYQFRALNNTFDSPTLYSNNSCYCSSYPCLPSGLHDLRSCTPDSPVFISWPHFLHGDPSLYRAVNGLHPDVQKHSFYMDVEPTYGLQLSAMGRLQMNIIAVKDTGFSWLSKLKSPETVIPFLWLEEGIPEPSEYMLTSISGLLTLPTFVAQGLFFGSLSLGLLLLLPFPFLLLYRIYQEKYHNGL